MTRPKPLHSAALMALVIGLAPLLAHAAPTSARKTITRVHDPVILLGSELPDLTGRSPKQIGVFAVTEGKAKPIPFQIDERHENGGLVISENDDESSDDEDLRGLDANDELVFMALDTGDRAERDAFSSKADVVVEIELTDPTTGEQAWAYALHFPRHIPIPADRQYVHFDAGANQATSDLYTVDYHDKGNFFTSLRIAPAAGGSGQNPVHRTRMRGAPTFSFLFGKFSLEFTEEDSMMELSGVKNGPVRATRQVDLSVDLGALFPELPSGRVETHHFRSSFLTPAKVSIPWVVLNLASDFSFVTLTDFREVADGTKYFDANHPSGLDFEGEPEMVLQGADHDWWVTAGKGGNFLQAFITPEEWQDWGVVRGTVFVDQDPGAPERPTTAGKHAAGFTLVDVEDIPEAGDYTLHMFTAVLEKPYQPGDESRPMAMVHRPLQTTVRALQRAEPLARNDARE